MKLAVRLWFAYSSTVPLDPNREIYANPQLNLVAFEIRYPPVPPLDTDQGHRAVYEALREELPILGAPPHVQIEMSPAGAKQTQVGMRLLDRRRTRTVTLTDTALTVETSAYIKYEDFAALIERALRVVNGVAELPAVLRVGLRYIDEIEVQGVETVEAWQEYIVDDLLAPGIYHGFPTVEYRGSLGLQVAEDHRVTLQFGVVGQPVVNADGPLRIPRSPSGPYFLLDIDSAWTAPSEEFVEFEVEAVLDRCEHLHDPVRAIFERAIKPKLRDDVLRREETHA